MTSSPRSLRHALRGIAPLAITAMFSVPLAPLVACSSSGSGDTTPTGCTKDSDCKGDRVCSKGECVDAGTTTSSGGGAGAGTTASGATTTATGAGGGATTTASTGTGMMCDPGKTLCGSACIDTTNDANHCGGCGMACASGGTCDASKCVSEPCDVLTVGASTYRFCITIEGGGKSLPLSWDEAEADCVKHGGHLVTINDAAEWQFVNSTLNGNYIYFGTSVPWIGLNDKQVEGSFVWVSGQSGYNKWQNGEPNGKPNENCVDFNNGGSQGYRDAICANKVSYICEK